jgi:hypothetical protein
MLIQPLFLSLRGRIFEMKKSVSWMMAVAWCVSLVTAGYAENTPPDIKDIGSISSRKITAFRTELEKSGFVVQAGKLGLVDVVSLCCAGVLPSCLGNNGSFPYLMYTIPPGEGQTVGKSNPWTFQLRPDEAIVFIGKTPPPVSYFSYRSYLMTRYYAPEQTRMKIFASLGDTLNNLTIKTTGIRTGDPFGQDTIIVTTADMNIEQRILKAARRSGLPLDIINTDVIPSSAVKLGFNSDSDEFVFLHRIALPKYGYDKEVSAYLQNPGGVVFRVTPVTPATSDPYPVPRLRVRGTGVTEIDLLDDLDSLRQAILTKYSGLTSTDIMSSVWLTEGFDAIQREMDVLGENRDTTYLKTEPLFTLSEDPNDFLIVYGVNHEATGKATYANFTVYGADLLIGVASEHSRNLWGSAQDYIPAQSETNYLYAWKVARHCNGEAHCTEVPIGDCPGLALDEQMFIVFRAYLERTTKVGPAYSEIVYDRAIKFSPAQ